MKSRYFYKFTFVLVLSTFIVGNARAKTERPIAFVNVNLVPMTAEVVIPDQTVLIRGRQIAAVGSSNSIKIPANATEIDGSSLYLMPGLADMHVHTDTKWLNGGWPVSPLNLFLANGVTTIRDFGPKGVPTDHALYWRDEIKKGGLQGPTIYAAGPILYGPVDNVQKVVRDQKNQGFDFLKLYSFLSKQEFTDAIETARKLDMYTAGHIPFAVGLDGSLSAGMNEIAHIEELDFEFLEFDRSLNLGHAEWFRHLLKVSAKKMRILAKQSVDEFDSSYQNDLKKIIKKLKVADTPVSTTLTVDDIVVQKLLQAEQLISQPTTKYLPYGFIHQLQQGNNRHQIQFKGYEDIAPIHYRINQLLLRELHKGGVSLVLGTDAGPIQMGLVPGFSLHDELRIMLDIGLRPYEAIKTATVNAADVANQMGQKGEFGTIEVGKRADLVLLNGNPLKDINNLKKIEGVMAAGQWFDKATLEQMIAPKIPVTGAVKHVYNSKNKHTTHLEVIIGKTFTGDLPDAIKSIRVTGPQGELKIGKKDFTYLPKIRDFWVSIPEKPQIGTYTFNVTSDQKNGSAVDIQAVVKTIQIPDVSYFLPSNGSTLKTDNPRFSWKMINTQEPAYSRLEIKLLKGSRVYSSDYVMGMSSHTVPKGLLKSGQSYRWRIRIADNDSWEKIQNRSQSAWQVFHIK